jgi:hypothetical protein
MAGHPPFGAQVILNGNEYVACRATKAGVTFSKEGKIRRRIRELIEYMQWRGGEETMTAYDHYFDAARHADIQDQLPARMHQALEEGIKRRSRRALPAGPRLAPLRPVDPDLAFLRGLGGANA